MLRLLWGDGVVMASYQGELGLLCSVGIVMGCWVCCGGCQRELSCLCSVAAVITSWES